MTKIFKFTAISEGISYIVLLINMLFVKPSNIELYKSLLFPIGMTHGILFMAYIYLAFIIKDKQNWAFKELFFVILGSIVPFGTFYIEKKYVVNE
jgi:integral membrane protein